MARYMRDLQFKSPMNVGKTSKGGNGKKIEKVEGTDDEALKA